ncbi:MAG TPA: pyridoxamine 5'-phosphate oxidase family protein [Glaciibacter sp.]|nr:pyridoxamine 5'-phosphate oxidase family protein [Glaciibacter sp.]
MKPVSELLPLPSAYGTPRSTLSWDDVSARIAASLRFWLSTVRADGRPHAIPVDGLWFDDILWFGGSDETVHHRNLLAQPMVAVHLEDALSAVIMEGRATLDTPTHDVAAQLARLSTDKYGYRSPTETFLVPLWQLAPSRVLAWTNFPKDATRFRFPAAQ